MRAEVMGAAVTAAGGGRAGIQNLRARSVTTRTAL